MQNHAFSKNTGERGEKWMSVLQGALTVLFYFLNWCRGDKSYKPNPRLARALDILFILHAEHEMNCSTSAARHLASRYIDWSTNHGKFSVLFFLIFCYIFIVGWMFILPLREQLEHSMGHFMVGQMRSFSNI